MRTRRTRAATGRVQPLMTRTHLYWTFLSLGFIIAVFLLLIMVFGGYREPYCIQYAIVGHQLPEEPVFHADVDKYLMFLFLLPLFAAWMAYITSLRAAATPYVRRRIRRKRPHAYFRDL